MAKIALLSYAVALVCFAGYTILSLFGDWTALVFFSVGLVVAGVAIVFLALAVSAAALGRGSIPHWGLAAAAVVFLGVATLSLMSLRNTGAPWLVAPVGAAAIIGAVAAAILLLRALSGVMRTT